MYKKFVLCTVWFPKIHMKVTVSETLNFFKKKEMGIADWSPIGLLLFGVYYYLKRNILFSEVLGSAYECLTSKDTLQLFGKI